MLLNSRFSQHQEVPKEYNLSSNDLFNTRGSQFVFAEEDLPGFKEKSKNTGLPLSVLRARSERVDKPRPARNRRGKEVVYRKAIPSKIPRLPLLEARESGVLMDLANREDEDCRQSCP